VHRSRLFGRCLTAVRYLWALPTTVVGLLFVPAALPAGGMQIVEGVLEVHGPVIAAMLQHVVPLRGGAAAITFGHVILGCDRASLERTRLHERVHVRQCERWGPAFIPAYLVAGAWAWVQGRGAYDGNWFEDEARRFERPGRHELDSHG
jgi:hypothetical protein